MVVRVSCHIISSNFAIMLQLPLLNPYPGPRSVLILDNCALHHIEEVCALVEDEARAYLYIKSLNIANTHHDSHDAYRLQIDLFTALFSRLQSYRTSLFMYQGTASSLWCREGSLSNSLGFTPHHTIHGRGLVQSVGLPVKSLEVEHAIDSVFLVLLCSSIIE